MRRDFDIDLWHGPVEDQKKSGRCWIYASLAPLRQKTGLRFSTNYVYYYDQLNKSRAFLEQIAALRDVPLYDPALSQLLREPISSVGQWCYFAAIADKHGLVPLEAMPDTDATADGTSLTRKLSEALRLGAYRVRSGESADTTLAEADTILRNALSEPPEGIDYGVDFHDYITLIHHPSRRWPVNRAYHETENPDERDPLLTLLSVDMETIKTAVLRQLQDGEQVVIGCDVRHAGNRAAGELSTERYGASRLSKTDAIVYREINACHVMSIDGWAADGRWKVQDSHGAETGPDGHYVMTDAWFDAYVLSAVVKKEHLPPTLLDQLRKPAFMPKEERF